MLCVCFFAKDSKRPAKRRACHPHFTEEAAEAESVCSLSSVAGSKAWSQASFSGLSDPKPVLRCCGDMTVRLPVGPCPRGGSVSLGGLVLI